MTALAGGILALDTGDLIAHADLTIRRIKRGEADTLPTIELEAAARRAHIAASRATSIARHLEKIARQRQEIS